MRRKRSRLALVGVMALAICVTVGLASGSVADAKKGKKKKKGTNSITLTTTTPTAIPAGDGTNQIAGSATIAFNVGKKAKGKVVSPDSLTATYQASDPAGNLDDLDLKIIAPNGRTVFLDNPAFSFGDSAITGIGPLTQTPDSPVGICEPNPTPPPPGCPSGSPDNSLGPPWAGTEGNVSLAFFSGVRARGTWQFKVLNFSTTPTHVLNLASIHMNLVSAPK
jgi:hypothetical protein